MPIFPIQWTPKQVSDAKYGREVLPDGRIKYWIEHTIVKSVTPEMLVWWFQHLEGDMDFQGKTFNRYHVWHPEDHVHVSYESKLPDGSVGVGAKLRIVEYFGRNKKYLVNVVSDIEKLDTEGFIHNPRLYGYIPMARMEYQFENTPEGTLYKNCLIIGGKSKLPKWVFRLIELFFFDSRHGLAWIKHNIEEVGQFESFLPELYKSSLKGK